MKVIATVRNHLPNVGIRAYDWVAFYHDEDGPGIGFGETERGAIDELTRLYPYNGEDD